MSRQRAKRAWDRPMSVATASARGLVSGDHETTTAPGPIEANDTIEVPDPETSERDVQVARSETPKHEDRFGLRNERALLLATGTLASLRKMKRVGQPDGAKWTVVRLANRRRRR